MKMKNDSFYEHLKIKLNQNTPKSLDQKILIIAKKELKDTNKSFNWIIPTFVTSVCLILFLIDFPYLFKQKSDSFVLTESPEMILNYNNIELMADASQLSGAEWEKIEGSK